MTTWIEPPPPQQGMGCFAKGCLIIAVFFFILGCAFVAGGYFAIRYLRTDYFPTRGVQLPVPPASEEEQQRVRSEWESFERRARAHEDAHLELTADEINALIESEPKLRGKAHVAIEDNVGRVYVSIPLDDVRWLRGHYLNGECTVRTPVNGSLADIRITSIFVNDRPVADEALQWRYGPWSVRRYLFDWSEDRNLKRFEIHDGKIILESSGGDH